MSGRELAGESSLPEIVSMSEKLELTKMEEDDYTSLLDKVVPSSSGDEMEQNNNKQPITKEPSDPNIINIEPILEVPSEQSIIKTEQGRGSGNGKLFRKNEAGRRKKVRHEQDTNKQPEEPSDHNINNTELHTKVPSDHNINNIELHTKVPSDQNINNTKPVMVTEWSRDQNINNEQGLGSGNGKPARKNEASRRKKVRREQNTNKQPEKPSDQNINNSELHTKVTGDQNINTIDPHTKVPSDQDIINTKPVMVTDGPRDDQNIINIEPVKVTERPRDDQNIINTEIVIETEGPMDDLNINTELGCGNENGKRGGENEADRKKKVRRVGGPYMDHVEFFNCYLSIYANVNRCGPYRCTPKKAIIDALLFISPKSLDKLEDGWMSYYFKGLEVGERRMALKRKMMKLLYEAQLAYKQKY